MAGVKTGWPQEGTGNTKKGFNHREHKERETSDRGRSRSVLRADFEFDAEMFGLEEVVVATGEGVQMS